VAGKTVGRLMSFCHSPAVGLPIGLGYLATTYSGPGMVVAAATDPPIDAEVVTLPFHRHVV
jgi:glycine cleavage system aminomethyltransferase T